jgi:membrane fusion protein (multidrug efflux system)
MRLFKQVGLLVIACAAVAGGYQGWQIYDVSKIDAKTSTEHKKRMPVTVETAAAGYRNLELAVEAVGSTLAFRSVEITPLAAGRVTKIGFDSGKVVKAGDVLLSLNDVIEQADLTEARARLKEATNTLKRSKKLRKQNAASAATVENLVAKVAISNAERDRATKRLKDRVITAPFSGVVGFSSVELGTRVNVGEVVTTLDDLSKVKVEFSLPESLFGTVGLGKRIVAHAAPFPGRIFNGTIETVNSRVDTVSRSFKARAIIANEDRALPAGMFVHLTVVLDQKKALSVPEEAIVAEGSRPYIYAIVKDGKQQRVNRRYVSLGQRSFGYVEITDGVAEGEQVVIRGIQKVKDGKAVNINNRKVSAKKKSPSKSPKTPGKETRS